MSDAVIAFTSIDSEEKATTLARELVDRKLAACVHIFPRGKSIYFWEGQRCEEAEFQLLIKTTADKVAALQKEIPALHSYEVPEFLVISTSQGAEPYLNWLRTSFTR
jgi:periplasmic divalent cation tolerance protein